MTKEEFISKLKRKIGMLKKSEIDDIISEYEGYIDEKMASGMTEKEAVKSLGDIDEIAKDLRSAYKLDDDYSDYTAKDVLDIVVDKIMYGVDVIIKTFEDKTPKDIIKLLIKTAILLIFIRLFKIPVDIVLDIAYDTFDLLGTTLGDFFFHVLKFMVNIIYFILAVVFFCKTFKDKILDENIIEEVKIEKDKKVNETKKEEVVKKENKCKNDCDENQKKERKTNKGFLDVCAEIVIAFIKFIVFWICIGNIFYVVAMASLVLIMIYLIINGVAYYGALLIFIALLSIGTNFLELFLRFIFDYKQKALKFIGTLIGSLIIGGAGIGILSIEVAKTTVKEINSKEIEQTVETQITMNENTVIDEYINEYIVDESLENKIKVETIGHARYVELEAKLKNKTEKGFEVYKYDYTYNWNNKSFDALIKDLKKKQVYGFNDHYIIKVYTSSKNIEKLKENAEKFKKSDEKNMCDSSIGTIGGCK